MKKKEETVTESSKELFTFNNILSFLIVILLVIVVIILLSKFASSKTSKNTTSKTNTFAVNLNNMKIKATEYFRENLPVDLGDTKEITLESIINKDLLKDFTNNGNMCSLSESKSVVSKRSVNGYTIKTTLVCGNKSSYILSEIITDEESKDLKQYLYSDTSCCTFNRY